MKTRIFFRRSILTLTVMMLVLTFANAQSRYKHLPRVKVDIQKNDKVKPLVEKTTITSKVINAEQNNILIPENITNVENTTVATVNEDVVTVEKKVEVVIKSNKALKTLKIADWDSFTVKVKENSKLMEVKNVKKSSMQKWLMIMIILLGVGLIMFIIGAIFSFGAGFGFGWIFWTLGSLCWIAAIIVLILGLTGVM